LTTVAREEFSTNGQERTKGGILAISFSIRGTLAKLRLKPIASRHTEAGECREAVRSGYIRRFPAF
jgi:hypothetical protein